VSKFKVGDRVISKKPGCFQYQKTGTVIEVSTTSSIGDYIHIRLDDETEYDHINDYHGCPIEFVSYLYISDTKITRKLYPDWEPDGKGNLKYVPR
jgi:hypothetical protein